MNLNWSNRVIKYVLFIFNLLFVISGIIMIAVGVSVKAYFTDYDVFLNSRYISLPNLLIATGSLIFFISFFGCCGAIKESWFMIFIFSVLLSIIFILEFSAGIAGYVLRDDTIAILEDGLKKTMDKYEPIKDNKTANVETRMWDLVQREFECCGVKNPGDWHGHVTVSTASVTPTSDATVKPSSETPATVSSKKPTEPPTSSETTPSTTNGATPASNDTKEPPKPDSLVAGDPVVTAPPPDPQWDLPASCCKAKDGAWGPSRCNANATDTVQVYHEGCADKFGDYLKDHAVTIGGLGIAIAFIQLFGVIFACHLARQLKHGFYST